MSKRRSGVWPAIRVLRLRGDETLLESLRSGAAGDRVRLAIPSRERVGIGDRVDVEISFGPLADEVRFPGSVAAVGEAAPGQPRLVAVHIDAGNADRLRYVEQVLRGDRAAAARSHRRIATDLPVSWRVPAMEHRSRLLDLSFGGAFIRSHTPPEIGVVVDLELELSPDAPTPLRLSSVVTWVRRGGHTPGFGVSFRLPDRDVATRLSAAVRRLEA